MKQPCTNYDTLSARLRLRVPDASVPQLHNLALFISGLVLAGHVHVPKIALFLPIAGNAPNAFLFPVTRATPCSAWNAFSRTRRVRLI